MGILSGIERRRRESQRHSIGATAYAGARMSRLTEDWVLAATRSADQEVRGDLRTLRERSRELARNSWYGRRFLQLLEDNVIGAHGMGFQAHVLGPDGRPDREINDRIEEAWREWGRAENCTVDGRLAFSDLEALVVRTWAQDGESLVRMVPAFDNPFGFALQFLDADQLDIDFNREPGRGARGERRNEIRMGVEMNAWGRPLAYHVWSGHPAEYSARGLERIPIPASQMIHFYSIERPGQTRGVPRFVSAMTMAKMLAGLEEAELVASRVAAAKGGWFYTEPEGVSDPKFDDSEEEEPIRMEVEPGVFDRLPAGWKFQEWDPQHPNNAFAGFHTAMLRAIAGGVGTSYHALTGDLTEVNYSSIRAGTLQERDAYRRIQWSVLRQFHDRVFLEFLRWALTTGMLELPSRDRDRWRGRRWMPRGWPWVDPEKDLRAAAMAIRLGLDSRTRLAGEQGRDFRDIVRELAEEEKLAREEGIMLSTDISRSGGRNEDEQASFVRPEVAAAIKRGKNGTGR